MASRKSEWPLPLNASEETIFLKTNELLTRLRRCRDSDANVSNRVHTINGPFTSRMRYAIPLW